MNEYRKKCLSPFLCAYCMHCKRMREWEKEVHSPCKAHSGKAMREKNTPTTHNSNACEKKEENDSRWRRLMRHQQLEPNFIRNEITPKSVKRGAKKPPNIWRNIKIESLFFGWEEFSCFLACSFFFRYGRRAFCFSGSVSSTSKFSYMQGMATITTQYKRHFKLLIRMPQSFTL